MTNAIRKTVLWLSAIVTAGFGLALLFASSTLLDLYGSTSSDSTTIMSRLFGGTAIGFTVLAIAAVPIMDVSARRAIDASFLTAYTLIEIATLWNTWQFGTQGAEVVVWSTVALYALFIVAFGYLFLGEDMRTSVSRARPMT